MWSFFVDPGRIAPLSRTYSHDLQLREANPASSRPKPGKQLTAGCFQNLEWNFTKFSRFMPSDRLDGRRAPILHTSVQLNMVRKMPETKRIWRHGLAPFSARGSTKQPIVQPNSRCGIELRHLRWKCLLLREADRDGWFSFIHDHQGILDPFE